ncbi:hypothetical protein N7468_009257 [Penicillium chermesinum]|uniref:Serine hydrolase domain-containing protein n=1 Tax=Penicillium chermesinum TaxID=63820 RepID=A0A9W9TEU6_9EURO|nr:uncharacterized protein N7468_009257 [Penicillium chermesinum]KAJ5220053.1 hypothetical protein N7468_009257 [Penicillium chermesinum]
MAPSVEKTRTPLKILMLHGYTQSGPLFHAKTRALTKHIQKAFPSHEVNAIYPTAPIKLDPSDIPGYEPSETAQEPIEAYGWWRRSNTADPPLYTGMEQGLATVAKVLAEEGPFDGVIGFSQGAAFAGMLAGLLEGRQESFARFEKEADKATGVAGIPFPESFVGLDHPPLKFALCYCGFRAPGARYRAFYEEPKIQTPVLHVIGTLDSVVDESRTRSLIEACEGTRRRRGMLFFIPGLILFLLEKGNGAKDAGEEDVNDMDVPF